MDQRFQAIIEAAVLKAKADKSLLWADEFAEIIVSSTPLTVRSADISEQISTLAARCGVAVTVSPRKGSRSQSGCEAAAA